MLELGKHVRIEFYHLPIYPSDPDDTAFLLCAENGNATHLVSYDSHLEKFGQIIRSKFAEPWHSYSNLEMNWQEINESAERPGL